MIPSQMDAYVQEEMEQINRIIDRVRYGTYHEVGDLLKVSSAYEKLAIRLLDLGQAESAFLLLADAAHCCTASRNNWEDTEWGEILCKPLRGRFFAMFCACKDLVRQYPRLRLAWERSGLQETCDHLTHAFRCFEIEWSGEPVDIEEAVRYNRALQFGKNEVYRHRRA